MAAKHVKHLKHKKVSFFERLRKTRLHHKVTFSLIGALGIIFIWKGVWDLLDAQPFYGRSLEIVLIGLILAAISGAIFKMS